MRSLQKIVYTLLLSAFLVNLPLFAQEGQAEADKENEAKPEIRLCRLQAETDLWSGPSRNFKIVRKAPEGLLLEIIGEKEGHYRVRVPDGFMCYIYAKYLDVDVNSVGKVIGENVYLRSIPRIEGDYPIFQVDRDEKLMVWDLEGEWYKITAPEEAYAYVPMDKVTIVEKTDEVTKELQALKASRFMLWTAHQKTIQQQLETKIEIGEDRSQMAALDAEVAGGFKTRSKEEVIAGYKEIADSSPDEAIRELAKAQALKVETLFEKEKFEAELKQREEDWRKEREELQKALDSAKREKPEPATHKSPGKGRAVTVIGMVDASGPEKLLRGGKSLADVLYIIECPDERYILPDFHGKRIRLNGRIADPSLVEGPKLIVIERIEILN